MVPKLLVFEALTKAVGGLLRDCAGCVRGRMRAVAVAQCTALLFSAYAIPTLQAQAQELASARASRTEVGLSEEFEVVIDLRPIENSNQSICNLVVDFGDGRVENLRAGTPYGALSLRHSYKRAGSSVIQVYGKMKFQGLHSAIGCLGNARTVSLNVLPDDHSARTTKALAERDAALRRAEADRRAAILAAEKARADRMAAEAAAKKAKQPVAATAPTIRVPPVPAPSPVAATAPPAAPKPPAAEGGKPPPPKAKSSLDL